MADFQEFPQKVGGGRHLDYGAGEGELEITAPSLKRAGMSVVPNLARSTLSQMICARTPTNDFLCTAQQTRGWRAVYVIFTTTEINSPPAKRRAIVPP